MRKYNGDLKRFINKVRIVMLLIYTQLRDAINKEFYTRIERKKRAVSLAVCHEWKTLAKKLLRLPLSRMMYRIYRKFRIVIAVR